MIDTLNYANHLFVQVNSKKGTQIPTPKPIQRPWKPTGEPETEKRKQASPADVAKFFNVRYVPKPAAPAQ